MTLREVLQLKIGERVITKSGITGYILNKTFIGDRTIYIQLKTTEGIVECNHKDLKCIC